MIQTKNALIGKFVTVMGFDNIPFYVASELGINIFEMVNTKTRVSYCIDTDCQPVKEIINLRTHNPNN